MQRYANHSALANVMAFCFLIVIAVLLVRHPQYDWDAFAYVAVALRDAGMLADQIHSATFKIMQDFLPPAYWDLLTGHGGVDPEFRQAVATNANAFMAQLPFFSVKPVYPVLMAALYKVGAGMITSAMAIVSAAYFGFGVSRLFRPQRGHHSRIAPDCALRTASREFRLVDRVTRALGAERQKGVPKGGPSTRSLIREILKYFVRRLSGCVTVTYSY